MLKTSLKEHKIYLNINTKILDGSKMLIKIVNGSKVSSKELKNIK